MGSGEPGRVDHDAGVNRSLIGPLIPNPLNPRVWDGFKMGRVGTRAWAGHPCPPATPSANSRKLPLMERC